MTLPALLSRLAPDTTPSAEYQKRMAASDRERIAELEQRLEQLQQENTGLALRADRYLDPSPHMLALTRLAEEVDAFLAGAGTRDRMQAAWRHAGAIQWTAEPEDAA